MDPKIIIRSSKPNSYDHAEQGTLCAVLKLFEPECDVYRQISSHSDLPYWDFVGTMKKDLVIPNLSSPHSRGTL